MESWISIVALVAFAILVALWKYITFLKRQEKNEVRDSHAILDIIIISSQLSNCFVKQSHTLANFLKIQPGKYSLVESKDATIDPFYIEPLPNFNWHTTTPLKFRNFKPKYHITMGLTNTTFSDLIQIDSNYLSRLHLRTQIIHDHHSIAIQASPTITPAVNELYTWITNTYLPTRFPTLFALSPSTTSLLNHATHLTLPLTPPQDPIKTLEILGKNLDEDILFLLPSSDGDGYVLRGYVTCFPSGFNTKEKFGLKLRDIHAPVPGYKEKLEKSMDRFFERLEVGKVVLRSNVRAPPLPISPSPLFPVTSCERIVS
jgi:Protein of unknown function (DUF3445)